MVDQLGWWDVKQLKTYYSNPEVLLLKSKFQSTLAASEMKPSSSKLSMDVTALKILFLVLLCWPVSCLSSLWSIPKVVCICQEMKLLHPRQLQSLILTCNITGFYFPSTNVLLETLGTTEFLGHVSDLQSTLVGLSLFCRSLGLFPLGKGGNSVCV